MRAPVRVGYMALFFFQRCMVQNWTLAISQVGRVPLWF